MTLLVRAVLWLCLSGLAATRFWASVAGLGLCLGLSGDTAVLLAALLLRAGGYWVLWIAALVGAAISWHLPWMLALPLATPRAFLMLPGVISTALANRRHPRMRWSSGPI
jgi:hypothetical protein